MKSLYWRLAYRNIASNKRIYFPYIISAIILIATSYIITSLSYNPNILAIKAGEIVASFLYLGIYVIVVFAVIFMFYTNSFMIRSRRKELGLYNVLGLEKRHIVMVMFAEFIFVAFISITSGLFFGVALDKLAFMTFSKMVGDVSALGFYLSPIVLVKVAFYYFILFFILFLYNALQVRKNTAITLLKSEMMGEKEPKARILLSIAGFIFLGLGYTIALVVKNPIEALVYFFLAVIFVIIGTYLLFVVGMTLILKILKSWKPYYYKTSHFISVSMMQYRMKKNAVGLANICILSTMVLVMISSTSALWFNTQNLFTTLYPYDARVMVTNFADEDYQKADEIVLNLSKKYDIDHYNVYLENIVGGLEVGENNFEVTNAMDYSHILHFIDLEGYNSLMGENVTLNDDEIMLFGKTGDIKEMTIYNHDFKVIYTDENLIEKLPQSQMVKQGEIQVVVKDAEVMRLLDNDIERTYNFYGGKAAEDLATATNIRFIDSLSDQSTIYLTSGSDVRDLILSSNSGLFFLGIFLSIIFLMAMVLIIYYKQIQEGSEDAKRFEIMHRVGLTKKDIAKTIRSQVWILFFSPLIVAIIHMLFAYGIINTLLEVLTLGGSFAYMPTFIASICIFIVFYTLIYLITSKIYYRMVTIK